MRVRTGQGSLKLTQCDLLCVAAAYEKLAEFKCICNTIKKLVELH